MGQLSRRGGQTGTTTGEKKHGNHTLTALHDRPLQQSSSFKMHSRTKLYLFLLCLTLLYAVVFMTLILPTETTATSSKDGTLLRQKGNQNSNVQQDGSHRAWDSMRHMLESTISKSITTTTSYHDETYSNNNNNIVIRNLSTESLSLFQPPFGFVLRDLARRILSRHITNSNILVLAPDAIIAAKDGMQRRRERERQQQQQQQSSNDNPLDTVDFTSPYSIGGTFLLHAAAEGHVLHAMNYGGGGGEHNDYWNDHTWDDWWQSFNDNHQNEEQSLNQQHWWSSSSSSSSSTSASTPPQQRPNWILAAVVDLPLGREDAIWAGATQFLQESTTTYFVVALHARRRSVSGGDNNVEYGGLIACQALLNRRYKLQVLLVSHYHVETPGKEAWTEQHYGPNALLSSTANVKEFLTWGATAAAWYHDAGIGPEDGSGVDDGPIFTAYIFATQGLDLAIPSNRVFLQDTSRVVGEESTTQINLYKPLQFKPCPQASMTPALRLEFSELLGETSIIVHVPVSNANSTTSTTDNHYQIRHYHRRAPRVPGFSYQYKGPNRKHSEGPKPEDIQLWFNGGDMRSAEAACVRLHQNQSRCTTRIVPQQHPQQRHVATTTNMKQQRHRPNLLLIMLDPMSRGQFERSMPQTRSALQNLGFVQFTNYTAVGSNSGPNQAALYSGLPLIDREGVKKHSQGSGVWLWDRLRDAGYVTLKAEDGCIENSNMIQSLKPNTTHGEALQQLFCFDFDRPNCLGPELASTHLMRYGEQFIDAYSSTRGGTTRSSWAAFLHFIDSHEDTMVLSSALDPEMSTFLLRQMGQKEQQLSNTIVLFLSDHGLHFGPHFQSVTGRRERTEPILYVRIPPSLQENSAVDMETLQHNSGLWTTAYDVHETIVQLLSGSQTPDKGHSSSIRKGRSLVQPLPSERKECQTTEEVPNEYCDLKQPLVAGSCQKMPRPPSILSFYADIPLYHRPLFELDCKAMGNKTTSDVSSRRRCQCSTSHRLWYRCDEHPWGPGGVKSLSHPEEYFALVKCQGQKMAVYYRVTRQDSLASRFARVAQYSQPQRRLSEEVDTPSIATNGIGASKSTRNQEGESRRRLDGMAQRSQLPNILFLEIDSVSLAYADRHFPLTRELLKRHRLRRDSSDGKVKCDGNVCAADFSLFSVVGPNSIANQAAALSGCVVSRFHDSCFGNKYLARSGGCSDGGMFTASDGSCLACPKGTYLADPLANCGPDASACCTSKYAQRNETRICRDETLFEHGLQLFRRGPRRHNTWCPAGSDTSTSVSSPWLFDVAKSLGYLTFFGDEFCYDGSPFVVQDNVFPLAPDFELQRLYCRLTESRQYNFTALGARLCADQLAIRGEVTNPGLAHLTDIWDAYPDVPKFAYLNALAAHDYDFEWLKMISASEVYDGELASFLAMMMARDDFANTIIVVRADHGLQGGPSTLEFPMQAEHREPWTQLVLPPNFVSSASLEVLFQNQERLATGYDLHRTLRELMWPPTTSSSSGSFNTIPKPPELPDWSFNLLSQLTPEGRTCREAKVPVDFCPCDDESPNRAPNFGVCNPFDDYGDLYCIENDEVVLPAVLEL